MHTHSTGVYSCWFLKCFGNLRNPFERRWELKEFSVDATGNSGVSGLLKTIVWLGSKEILRHWQGAHGFTVTFSIVCFEDLSPKPYHKVPFKPLLTFKSNLSRSIRWGSSLGKKRSRSKVHLLDSPHSFMVLWDLYLFFSVTQWQGDIVLTVVQ